MKLNSPLEPLHRRTREPGVSGFTLLELLVVITIIAILAGLVFASMNSARQASARANCASNVRQLGSLLRTYAAENGALPNGAFWDQEISRLAGVSDLKAAWKLLECPADKRVHTNTFHPRSYVVSAMSNPDNGRGVFGRYSSTLTMESRPLAQVVDSSNTVMLMELFTGNSTANQQFKGAFAYTDPWLGGKGPVNPNGTYYHGSGNNYLFCDGHVETLTVPQVINPKANLNRWTAN